MDRARRVVNEKHERILLEMTKQPGNDTCADCGAKGPRWASHNLGVFLCIRCGGLHRKMGTHISKIKSISLDSWTPEQIENMRQWGNLKANARWNPHPEFHPVPVNASDSEMERYIRNKYERQIYREHSDKSKQSTSVAPPPTPPRRATNNERGNHDNALRQLKDMGFTDNARNREILNTTNGDLSAAIEILCRLPSGTAPSTPTRSSTIPNISSDDKLTQLWNLKFQDEAKNCDALRRTGGNVEAAAALLFEARDAESLNNNNTNSSKPNPSANSQTEQQRMQIKLISQSSSQTLLDPPSSQQISFQQSQTSTQNSSQNLSNAFGSFSGNYQQQQTQQQQQNKFDKNAILSLYNAPQQSSITTSSNSFNSMNMNNGIQLRSPSSGFGQQQNQFSQQTQQNLAGMGGVSFFGNTGISTSSSNGMNGMKTSDLNGLSFNTNDSTVSSNGSNGLNKGFGSRNLNSSGTGTNGGNFVSTTSNIPFGLNNNALSSNNNLFGANIQQQNSMASTGMMTNRQNSLSNFGNTTPTTSFLLNENTSMPFNPTSNTSNFDRGFGQLQHNSAMQQQITTSSGFGLQQQQISSGQSNGLKNSFSQNQLNNNNHLFPTMRSTTNTNSGWPDVNNLGGYNH